MEDRKPSGRFRCRVLGHRFVFRADGADMTWACTRCSAGGSKQYQTTDEAARLAKALNVRSTDALGKRAPLVGLLPLRVWRWYGQHVRGRVPSKHSGEGPRTDPDVREP